jgi:twitching motility protein PilT
MGTAVAVPRAAVLLAVVLLAVVLLAVALLAVALRVAALRVAALRGTVRPGTGRRGRVGRRIQTNGHVGFCIESHSTVNENTNGRHIGGREGSAPVPSAKALFGTAARAVCASVDDALPDGISGDERLRRLGGATHQLAEEERAVLRGAVDRLAGYGLDLGASDVDFGGHGGGGQVWYRVDGRKEGHEEVGTYTAVEADALILNLLSESQQDELLETGGVHFSHRVEEADGTVRRFRATVYAERSRAALNLRAIPDEIRPLGSLGFHPAIERGLMFQHVRNGLTLITGVTGSGKSTTLDAIIDANNEAFPGHIVVIADPVEYVHTPKKCLMRHREVGRDVPTYKAGITQALRQDPDMVVIGELRDPETIMAALEITDSGHRVFSTLHTPSATETIARIVAEMPSTEQERVRHRLADVLQGVVSQKLLPKPDGGRVLAKEVLWVDSGARAAIQNDNVSEIYQMMWQGGDRGQLTLEQDLHRLVRKGTVEAETALDFANNTSRLRRLL